MQIFVRNDTGPGLNIALVCCTILGASGDGLDFLEGQPQDLTTLLCKPPVTKLQVVNKAVTNQHKSLHNWDCNTGNVYSLARLLPRLTTRTKNHFKLGDMHI
jgi:hypothetical protein